MIALSVVASLATFVILMRRDFAGIFLLTLFSLILLFSMPGKTAEIFGGIFVSEIDNACFVILGLCFRRGSYVSLL